MTQPGAYAALSSALPQLGPPTLSVTYEMIFFVPANVPNLWAPSLRE